MPKTQILNCGGGRAKKNHRGGTVEAIAGSGCCSGYAIAGGGRWNDRWWWTVERSPWWIVEAIACGG